MTFPQYLSPHLYISIFASLSSLFHTPRMSLLPVAKAVTAIISIIPANVIMITFFIVPSPHQRLNDLHIPRVVLLRFFRRFHDLGDFFKGRMIKQCFKTVEPDSTFTNMPVAVYTRIEISQAIV